MSGTATAGARRAIRSTSRSEGRRSRAPIGARRASAIFRARSRAPRISVASSRRWSIHSRACRPPIARAAHCRHARRPRLVRPRPRPRPRPRRARVRVRGLVVAPRPLGAPFVHPPRRDRRRHPPRGEGPQRARLAGRDKKAQRREDDKMLDGVEAKAAALKEVEGGEASGEGGEGGRAQARPHAQVQQARQGNRRSPGR